MTMESKAVIRYARVSPRKARRVVDLIRGRKAGEAMLSLRFMPYRAARQVEKLLKSAMANAGQRNAADPEAMRITRAFVDQGPAMKRMMPRAMGRANIIKKRLSHITLYLSDE
ncbi:MAG: 50S ribosomal protein L22 [Thermodesulfovibrionales bacterium]